MDKHEKDRQRRARIQQLIDERCGGVIAEFARRIGMDFSYVGRMLYPMGKAGKRGITVHTIDTIEAVFRLPHGWLDGIEPPDEYMAEITRLWPQLAPYKRRAIARMALDLAEDTDEKKGGKESSIDKRIINKRRNPPERRDKPRPGNTDRRNLCDLSGH